MAIDLNTLSKLSGYLEERIQQIEEDAVTLDKLQTDIRFADLIERRLQTAIEAVINISEHLVTGLNLAHPDTAKDAILTLGKSKIIDQELADKLGEASDMRNILVHLYTDIKLERVAEAATQGLGDLRKFAKKINEFLEKNQNL